MDEDKWSIPEMKNRAQECQDRYSKLHESIVFVFFLNVAERSGYLYKSILSED
jgi:hypothetical protein